MEVVHTAVWVSDIEATVNHLKASNPDVFLTTVAYPIKGTHYYDEVEDRVVTELPWAVRTDRDLQVNGRYSRRFYDHATRWMVNEVNLHRARQAGCKNPLRLGKMFLNAKRGRLGMRLTQHQREDGGVSVASGRGWIAIALAFFGGWTPHWILAGSLFFAAVEVLASMPTRAWLSPVTLMVAVRSALTCVSAPVPAMAPTRTRPSWSSTA
jgi:hypothetical protein